MKCLVTGGAGFIGSNLVKKLISQGAEVAVIDNLLSGHSGNLSFLPSAQFVQGDIRDPLLLERMTRDVDVIFHLAAAVGNKRSIHNPFLDADINVMGTLQVLEAARKNRVKKVVFSSSAGTFGELKYLPINESHPAEPRTPYGCSKLYAEKVGLAYADLYGIEVVCLRYFNVFGPNQRFDEYGNVIPIFVFNLLNGRKILIHGDGEQTRDFVNVADVVNANIQSARTQGLSGAFNIASGTCISINQLVHELSLISETAPVIEYVAPPPGNVRESLADISAAQQAFGYQPSADFKKALKEYYQWALTEVKKTSLQCVVA